LRPADDWWNGLLPVFEEAFIGCRISPEQARALAARVRSVYTDVSEWRLYDDTLVTLRELHAEGWNHAILSNHVPELPALIHGLGLGVLVDHVVNSAETGFEKPHPGAFRAVLAKLQDPAEIWMIGDNIEADFFGAESAGLSAILVRSFDMRAARRADGLREVRNFLG